MKNHKYQLIRIGVPTPGAQVRFSGETDKGYAQLKGVFVATPGVIYDIGSSMSLKVGGLDVFDEDHDVRLVTSSLSVAPNKKFYEFPESLEAGGTTVEGRYTDAGNTDQGYPYEAKLYLWLSNDTGHE